jgi:hypothetical protein
VGTRCDKMADNTGHGTVSTGSLNVSALAGTVCKSSGIAVQLSMNCSYKR